MKISSRDWNINKILKAGYYKIPRFQRPYSWEKAHVQEFWSDVMLEENKEYFIGAMVVYKQGMDGYGIVDGQQRITTIIMLLCA